MGQLVLFTDAVVRIELELNNYLSPIRCEISEISDTEPDIQVHVNAVLESKPISSQKLAQIRQETAKDEQLQTSIKFIKHGWPEHARNVPVHIHDLYGARLQLSVLDMLAFGSRIVIPTTLRLDILNRIHEGHLGINKCKEHKQLCGGQGYNTIQYNFIHPIYVSCLGCIVYNNTIQYNIT